MSDNKVTKYLKRGLLVSLFASTTMSSMGQSSFEEYKQVKTEQLNKFRQQKKAEMDSFRQQKKAEMDSFRQQKRNKMVQYREQRGVQQQSGTHAIRVETIVPEKMDGLEVHLTGIAGGNLGLGLEDIHSSTAKDGSLYYFWSPRGVATLNADGQGFAGVLEKDGKVHYYMYDDKSHIKEEDNDVRTKEMIKQLNSMVGDPNSDFSKALSEEVITLGKVDTQTLNNPALWGRRGGGNSLG